MYISNAIKFALISSAVATGAAKDSSETKSGLRKLNKKDRCGTYGGCPEPVAVTPAPTPKPTPKPTDAPIQMLTLVPTKSPVWKGDSWTGDAWAGDSHAPSSAPTVIPFIEPTWGGDSWKDDGFIPENPTMSPTLNPTLSPTLNPTLSPVEPEPIEPPTWNGDGFVTTDSPTKKPTWNGDGFSENCGRARWMKCCKNEDPLTSGQQDKCDNVWECECSR